MLNLKQAETSQSAGGAPNGEEMELVSHLFEREISEKSEHQTPGSVQMADSYIKVPMKDCLRQIENYEVEMFRGWGHVQMGTSIKILETIFNRTFRKENQKIRKNMSNFTKSNFEFKMIVDSLKEYKQHELSGERPAIKRGLGFQINVRDIDYFAQNHFPLCMYDMFRTFKRDRHLKHNGRLQLILFMKGLGLKAEELINFFKAVVSKGPAAKKIKEYEYMIKHSYGLVGGKTEYSGMGCPKIMSNSRPSKGDVHGCPFNYYGEDSLFKLLMHKLGNESEAKEILKANSMGAKFGCRKFFCTKLKLLDIEDVDDGIGRHPNIYFNVSYFRKGRKRAFQKKEGENKGEMTAKSNKIVIENTAE